MPSLICHFLRSAPQNAILFSARCAVALPLGTPVLKGVVTSESSGPTDVGAGADPSAIWLEPATRRVLDAMTEMFVAYDREFRIVFGNKAFLEATAGYDFVGRVQWDIWPDMRGTIVEASYCRAFETGLPVRFDFHYATSDTWVDVNAYPSGNYLHVYFRDITAQKQAEEAARQQLADLLSLVDSMPQIAWVSGTDGLPAVFNERWWSYTGAPRDGDCDANDYVEPADLERLMPAFEYALAREEGFECEARIRRHDGEYRWHLVRTSPRRSRTGAFIGYFGTSTDVHRLKDAEEILQATTDAVAVMITFIDSSLIYRFCNRAYEHHFGVSREDIVGRQMVEVLGSETFEKITPYLRKALAGERTGYELWIDYPAVGRRFMRGNYVPRVNSEGKVDGIYALISDETEFRLAQEALAEKERGLLESERRLRLLADLSQAITLLKDPESIANEMCRRLGEHLGVSRVTFGESDRTKDLVSAFGEWAPGLPSILGEHDIRSFGEAAELFRRGERSVTGDVWRDLPEEAARAYEQYGIRAHVTIPLKRLGDVRGVVGVQSSERREWTEEELDLIQVVADRTWASINRARAENALVESEERFRTLADNISQFAWMGDAAGNLFWYNERWFEYTGTTLEEMQGWGWAQVHHPEHADRVVAAFRACVEAGEPFEDTFPLRSADGTYRWFLTRAHPIRNEAGEVIRWFGTNTDVTDLRDTQEALRRIEQRYYAGVNAARGLVYEWDVATGTVLREGNLLQLVGVSVEDAPATPEWWLERTHPEDYARLLPYAKQYFDGHIEDREVEYRVRHEDGSWVWVADRAVAERDADGRVTRMVGQAVDITDRKRIEARLEASEALYRTTAELIPQILTHNAPDGSLIWANAEWNRYFGIPPDGTVDPREYLHPDERDRMLALWRQALQKNKPLSSQLRLRRRDGEYRWFQSNIRPVYGVDGAIDRWIGSFTDIHDHVLLAQAIQEREYQYRQIAESLPQIVLATQPDGVPDYYNSRWYEYTGLPNDGTPFSARDFLYPDDLDGTLARWQHSLQTGEPFSVEYRVRSIEGVYRWFLALGRPITDREGNILRWFATLTDIHDKKQMEEELERRVQARTMELEAANRELEGFTYSIAHDLRGPLRALVSTSSMLLEDAKDELSLAHQELLHRQIANSKKLSRLIDDLLQFARLSRQALAWTAVDMTELAEDVAHRLKEAYADRPLDFFIQPGLKAHGDPSALRVMVQNLLENAAKFSPNGGTIALGRDLSGHQAFYVADEGIGLDEQYCDQIFRPFERLHRDEEFPGTGIGLANVRRIVERHGGKVWVESQPGNGATFYFTLL